MTTFTALGLLTSSVGAGRLDGAYLHRLVAHEIHQYVKMLAARQRLVALHVDVNVGPDLLRDFVNAIRSTAVLGRGQAIVPAILPADGGNFLRVGWPR